MPSRLQLRAQLTIIMFCLFCMALLFAGYFNVSIVTQMLLAEARAQAKGMGDEMSTQIVPLVGTPAIFQADTIFFQFPNLRELTIVDAAGRVQYQKIAVPTYATRPPPVKMSGDRASWGTLLELDEDKASVSPATVLSILSPRRGLVYEYHYPLWLSNQPGLLFNAVFTVNHMTGRLSLLLAGNVIITLLFLLIGYVSISVWIEHAIRRPLNFILVAQDQLASGDFSTRVPLEEKFANEVVSISDSFNRMTAEVSRYQAALLEKTARLEEVNQQYRQLNQDLEMQVDERTRDLREFFSLITHELKVPLAAIQGYTHLLLKQELSDKQKHHLQSIKTATWHLLQLLRNMTQSVKYEVAQPQVYCELFKLTELMDEVRGHLGPAIDERTLKLVVEIPDGCMVYADKTRIGQVLINLLSNAARYSPQGDQIEVKVAAEAGRVEVRIKDHGSGIAAESLPHLFDKFSQFGTADATAQGLGLGLYICRRVLEDHGQSISVETALDEGTTFIFHLDTEAPPEPDAASS